MGTSGNTPAVPSHTVHLAGPENTRLHFSGPPNAVTGSIPLVNEGAEKQKVRSIAVSSDKLLGAARLPLREIPFYARLYGRDQVNVPATLRLDPQTPPGTYDLELTVGARTLPATAHVSEVVNLRLDPVQITILAGSGSSYTRTLIFENAGNVPLSMGAQSDAPIFDSDDLVTTFLIGLSKGDRKSAESMAKAFLNEWAELKAGTLVAKRKAMVIAPGRKLVTDVEFQLPTNLRPQRHYRADLQLYDASLSVNIYTTAKAGSSSRAQKKQEASPDEHGR
jgi:hypothetical protein